MAGLGSPRGQTSDEDRVNQGYPFINLYRSSPYCPKIIADSGCEEEVNSFVP